MWLPAQWLSCPMWFARRSTCIHTSVQSRIMLMSCAPCQRDRVRPSIIMPVRHCCAGSVVSRRSRVLAASLWRKGSQAECSKSDADLEEMSIRARQLQRELYGDDSVYIWAAGFMSITALIIAGHVLSLILPRMLWLAFYRVFSCMHLYTLRSGCKSRLSAALLDTAAWPHQDFTLVKNHPRANGDRPIVIRQEQAVHRCYIDASPPFRLRVHACRVSIS